MGWLERRNCRRRHMRNRRGRLRRHRQRRGRQRRYRQRRGRLGQHRHRARRQGRQRCARDRRERLWRRRLEQSRFRLCRVGMGQDTRGRFGHRHALNKVHRGRDGGCAFGRRRGRRSSERRRRRQRGRQLVHRQQLRGLHRLQREILRRQSLQPFRIVHERPVGAQHARALASLVDIVEGAAQRSIESKGPLLDLIEVKPGAGSQDQTDAGERSDHVATPPTTGRRKALRRALRARGLAATSAGPGRHALRVTSSNFASALANRPRGSWRDGPGA
jgi:hypothetical protein